MLRKVFILSIIIWLAFAPALFVTPGRAETEKSAAQAIQSLDMSNHAETSGEEAENPPPAESAPPPEAEAWELAPAAPPQPHTIFLKSRQFQPGRAVAAELDALAPPQAGRVHLLVQLDFIPREQAKAAYEAQGLRLLAYVPDYAWIASYSASGTSAILGLPGVTWAGALLPEDKLDPAIQAGVWSDFNLKPDGTAAVYVAMHLDESLEKGRALVESYGGAVTGQAAGINLLMAELPLAQVQALAREDAVQWIEPAAPPLDEVNDGIRAQIGVNTANAVPYSLDGSGIDVLVYDSGQVGDHPDFTGRLTHGDAESVSDHSTHVAGTLGGNGSQSASAGGTAQQWRGMAPGVDIISYGAHLTYNYIFYNDVGDIEADWAAAQNTHGADMGTASLGMNIYANYPDRCDLMGNYGATSVLMDQIVRGGNSAVGIGDRYIATWAAGNERGSPTSCGTYSTTAEPATAKNLIQVGATNTNDNSMTTFSSWGPTDDGRLKPIIVAGGEQIGGDGGIKSTIADLFINIRSRDCDGTGDDYCYPYDVMQGTSMATPAVAGGVALMLQHYRDVYNTSGNPWPSTIKAILMQSADDLGNPAPDYQFGFGQVNLPRALDIITRRAFRQDSVENGAVDVFYLPVASSSLPLAVSLAWDDFEAAFNASVALVNDLNLELVAPSGTIYRPWVLNPASPASNATRGVDNRNNQEQVTIPNPEVGTWLVRVRGTTVPQSPQNYSLVCEGCKPLDLGVCQSQASGTTSAEAQAASSSDEGEVASDAAPEETWMPLSALSRGELWQRSLESDAQEQQALASKALRDELASLEVARREGAAAVLALAETLSPKARDLAEAELRQAQEELSAQLPPPPPRAAISAAEETALAEADLSQAAANRLLALTNFTDPLENHREASLPAEAAPSVPTAPAADLTVGNGCTYATIAAAVAAAAPGDRLLLEGNRTFTENVVINKNLTVQGGYNGCASASSALTTVNGNAANPVFVINEGLTVSLRNLNITNGVSAYEGGGIRFAWGSLGGTLTLQQVNVYGNSAQWGGGIWVGPNASLVGDALQVYNNTATAYGGGLRLFGGRVTLTNSNIYNNSAPLGGGVYATRENNISPQIDLPSYADVFDNQALTGSGLGGGVYLRQGSLNATDCSDLYYNDAIIGGGAYLITSTLTLDGSCSEIEENSATGDGGGVYATDSTVYLNNQAELRTNDAGASGGGAYLDDSDLYGYSASITFNSAYINGGGVAAYNNSTVTMGLGDPTCAGLRCSQLANNSVTIYYGGGVYANSSDVTLTNTFVESNSAAYGGGVYAIDSSSNVALYSTVFDRNNATSSIGDAVRLNSSASLTGSGNTLAYNDSNGAATGRAFDLVSGTSLDLSCSIIWGHTSSINQAGMEVTYSDVQGGYTGEGNINQDPLFVAAGSQDFHLQSGSPAIDRCISGQGVDFESEARPILRTSASTPYDMGADEYSLARVGVNGACAYNTIQQAVNAAPDGAEVRLSSGVYFENVDLQNKNLTIRGGYDATCTTFTGASTRVNGSLTSGSVFDISGGRVTLRDLVVEWGSSQGAGLDVMGGARVTLYNTNLTNNHGSYGGGVWSDVGTIITATNGANLLWNTATTTGGGGRIWGSYLAMGSSDDVNYNCAPDGGGFSINGGSLALTDADMFGNLAAGGTGKGGAIFVEQGGVVTLSNLTYIGELSPTYANHAQDGAGLYADASTVYLNGSNVVFTNNQALRYGGGLHLNNGSQLIADNPRIGLNMAGGGNRAQVGGGIYADASTVQFGGRIYNNLASLIGAGLYAMNNSVLNLNGAYIGGTGVDQPNQLEASGHEGVGMYLTTGTRAELTNVAIANNIFQTSGYTYGGGIYIADSSAITLTNSTIQGHVAPSTGDGRGAGMYILNSRAVLDHSQVLDNQAGYNGGGIRLFTGGVLTVRNGSSILRNRAINAEGGGIAASNSSDINIENSTLQDNQAGTHGGAIYVNSGTLDVTGWFDLRYNHADGNGGAVAIEGTANAGFFVTGGNSYLAVNTAGGNGGAIYLGNNRTTQLYATSGYQLRLNTNQASGNGGVGYSASGGFFDAYGDVQASSNIAAGNGGVFYLGGGSRLWLDDYFNIRPQIWVNQADNGGAVYATGGSLIECDGAEMDASPLSNQATDGSGGAFYLDSSTLIADNCIFRNNTATYHGGAIAAFNASTVTIGADYDAPTAAGADRQPPLLELSEKAGASPLAPAATMCNPLTSECSAFSNNIADSDGNMTGNGGAIYISGSNLTLDATLLYQNRAVRGGGVFQIGSASNSTVSNSLFYANQTSESFGAGIRSEQGVFNLQHVTLADNINGAGFSVYQTTSQVTQSIAWGNTNGGFWGTVTSYECNIDQSGNAGVYADPLFVGGGNYHLQSTSPAINACTGGLGLDLDNRARPKGALYDMGAYEYPLTSLYLPMLRK